MRRTWQIGAEHVHIGGRHWAANLQAIQSWPEPPTWGGTRDAACRFLDAVRALEDREAILAFIGAATVGGDYGQGDNAALVSALALFSPPDAAEAVRRIVTANAARDPAACADLLRRMSDAIRMAHSAAATDSLYKAAASLITALPGQPAAIALGASRQVRPTPALVVDLFLAIMSLQADEAGIRLVTHVLAQPAVFPMDKIVVPAALTLVAGAAAQRSWPPIRELTGACRNHLAQRIAEPLEAPTDFSRPSHVTCRCPHCIELARFLADPKRKQWVLKAAEAHRSHVEASIGRDACDVDTETLRHTRPYELCCTKNQASYQRRVEQRKRDLHNHAQLLE